MYLHALALDFITGLPLSKDGKDSILTVTDKFCRAIRLIPCNSTTGAEEIAQLFLRYVYPVFGLPVNIISDRDAMFTSKFWQTLTELLRIQLGIIVHIILVCELVPMTSVLVYWYISKHSTPIGIFMNITKLFRIASHSARYYCSISSISRWPE